MTRTIYNKLVRDVIPDLIRREGARCGVDTLDQEAFGQALRDKLVEEAREAADASSRDELIAELADVQEVIDALLANQELTRDEILEAQQRRRLERGGFTQRLLLQWTE